MLFDGRFYNVESVTFIGDDCSQEEYSLHSGECISRRPKYYKTDPIFCYSDHKFVRFDEVLTSELIDQWIKLQDELDIVHQMIIYNSADTGITHDVKCVFCIECLEPMAELIGLYDTFFPSLKTEERSVNLKMCIDAVISKFGIWIPILIIRVPAFNICIPIF